MSGRWRSPRIDKNQPQIVAALEAHGWRVMLLSSCGGAVDLLVSDLRARPAALAHSGDWICEVKDPAQPPCKRRLKKRCADAMLGWPGPGAVVLTPEDAVEAGDRCRRGVLESAYFAARDYVKETGGVAP